MKVGNHMSCGTADRTSGRTAHVLSILLAGGTMYSAYCGVDDSWEQRTDCAAMMGKIKICVFMFGAYLHRTRDAIIDMLTKAGRRPALQTNSLFSNARRKGEWCVDVSRCPQSY